MNRLSTEDRTRAIACLVEGNSQQATDYLESPAFVALHGDVLARKARAAIAKAEGRAE